MPNIDMEHLRGWIGRKQQSSDQITAGLVERFHATIGHVNDVSGESIALGLHWCLAPAAVLATETGGDGHPKRGGFLPPVQLERRMWAGGQIEFVSAFEIGDEVERISTIADITEKVGRSGLLVLVDVDHTYSTSRGIAIRERQTLVYRDDNKSKSPTNSPSKKSIAPADHSRKVFADTLLMFRYSALTFNGHRIHYDQAYARDVEGYRGAVFHGPLQATMLMNFALELSKGSAVKIIEYRGTSPLFADDTFSINATANKEGFDLWCADGAGQVTMQAKANF